MRARSSLGLVIVAGLSFLAIPRAEGQCLATHGRIVAMGCEPLSISRDDGATFTDTRLRVTGVTDVWSSSMGVSVSGTERAPRVEIVLGYGLSCWGTIQVRRVIVDASGVEIADLLDDVACESHREDCAGFFDVELGAHGSAYAVYAPREDDPTPRPSPLLLVRPTERVSATSLVVPPEARLTVAHNGRMTIALLDGVLHRLEGARVRSIGGRIEPEARLVHVDDRGRPFAVTTTGTFRYSRRTGWSAIGP